MHPRTIFVSFLAPEVPTQYMLRVSSRIITDVTKTVFFLSFFLDVTIISQCTQLTWMLSFSQTIHTKLVLI